MAEILDKGWDDEPQEPREARPTDDEVLPPIQEEEDTVVQETEDEIPEKYKGKSVKDLVRMHQEAEKAMGRQGSEVGELRKVIDEYIKTSQREQQAPQEQPEEEVDWFADPDKALEAKLTNHPKFKALESEVNESKKEKSIRDLQAKHPDYKEILQDEGFASWVGKSKIRQRLLVEADQSYDTDAADELFSLWKERQELAKSTVAADKASRQEAVKAASNGGARGANVPTAKKKFRRADIIRLMNTDPERYALLQDEILKAYAEGRVK